MYLLMLMVAAVVVLTAAAVTVSEVADVVRRRRARHSITAVAEVVGLVDRRGVHLAHHLEDHDAFARSAARWHQLAYPNCQYGDLGDGAR